MKFMLTKPESLEEYLPEDVLTPKGERPRVGDTRFHARVDGPTVRFDRKTVVSLTPKGFRVQAFGGVDNWYSDQTRKWSRSKPEAMARLKARAWAWVKHARRNLLKAENAYRQAHGEDPPFTPWDR